MYSDDVQCVNVLGTDCTDGTICMESLYVGTLHLVTDMYHCVLCLSIGVGTLMFLPKAGVAVSMVVVVTVLVNTGRLQTVILV